MTSRIEQLMQPFSMSPAVMINSLRVNRNLIHALIHREIVGRYKGSMPGIFWSLFTSVFMLLAWLAFYVVLFGFPPVTIFHLPLVLHPLALLTPGVSWLLASLSVYLRDIGLFVGIITMLMLVLSPIFHPLSALPKNEHAALQMNPLTLPVEMARNALFRGTAPHWGSLAGYTAVALLVAWAGFAWFQKTRKGFADVI